MIMAPQTNISEPYLKRLATVYDNQDVASQTIREMASELLSLRQQIALQQAPTVEPAQRCNCCGYLVTDSEHRGCIRAAQQEPAQIKCQHCLDTGEQLGVYGRIKCSCKGPAQAVPVGYISEEDVYWFEQCGTVKISKRPDSIKTVPVFADVPPAIDETQQRALDFVRWIASLKTGGLIQARANDLLSMLEAGNEN